jgi:hypothetical protein
VRRNADRLRGFRLYPGDTRDNETIAVQLILLCRREMARRDESALMRVSADRGGERQRLFTKQPTASRSDLELTRSLASVSNIYSPYVADLWLTIAIEAKRLVKSLPLHERRDRARDGRRT